MPGLCAQQSSDGAPPTGYRYEEHPARLGVETRNRSCIIFSLGLLELGYSKVSIRREITECTRLNPFPSFLPLNILGNKTQKKTNGNIPLGK